MVQSLMLIALGFLTATLFAIVAVQLAWRRAVTVTTAKLRAELNLDEAQQTADHLVNVETALEDKRHELAEMTAHANDLSGRNAELENTLAAASAETRTLRDEIADIHAQYEAARSEAEQHADELAALQAHAVTLQSHIAHLQDRIVELEVAAAGEIDRQGKVEAQLRSLGEKAARIVAEMNEAFGQVADASGLQAAMAPATVAEEHQTPATLAPYPAEDTGDDDLSELDAIKASLSKFSEGVKAEFGPGKTADEDAPLPNENFLAERIRALEEGVAARH